MTFPVAAAYAANFRPVQPVPGFPHVKSDIATQVLSRIPEVKFAAETAMAQSALSQGAESNLLAATLESLKDREEAARVWRAEQDALLFKKKALLNLAQLGGDTTMQRGNPLKSMIAFGELQDGSDRNVKNRMAGQNEILAAFYANQPQKPVTNTPGIDLNSALGSIQQPAVQPLNTTTSMQKDRERWVLEIMQGMKPQNPAQ